jgi:hypothetical protein
MKSAKYVLVVLFYLLLAALTTFVPSMMSPSLVNEIIYDVAMLVLVINVLVTMIRFEPGSNNHIFWKDLLIAAIVFLALRIAKVYVAGVLFNLDPATQQYFNIGYLVAGAMICVALYKAIRLYSLELKRFQIATITITGLVVFALVTWLILSGVLGKDNASIITVISCSALLLIGVVIIILSMLLIAKTYGGQIQNVLILIATGFFFMVLHQSMYIFDKMHGLENAAVSPGTGIPYYIFCACCVIAGLMRMDIQSKEDDAVKELLS